MTRARALTVARIVLFALVLLAVVFTIARNWSTVRHDLGQVSPSALALSSALALLGLVFTLLGWRALLADLGSPLHIAPASGVLFVGQLGKYLPGSVWTVVAQAEVAAGLGVPRARSTVVGLLSVLMSAMAGLGVGMVALPGLLSAGGGPAYLLLVVLLVAGVVVLHPRVLNRVVDRALRLARRQPPEQPLSGRAIVVTMVFFVLAWLSLGLHVWVLVRSLGGDASATLLPSVFGYALAASLGMLALLLPAGLGLREVLLGLLLSDQLPHSVVLTVVILSRFIVTLADVLAAAVGWGYARSHRLLAPREVS